MNPSGQPFPNQFGGAPPPPGGVGGGGAREAVNVAGILLIVFGALSAAYSLFGMVGGGANPEQLAKAMNDPNFPAAAKGFVTFLAGPGAKILNLITLLMSGFVIFGGVQMRNLKSYGVAIAACIVGMLPCTGCCCVTLPVGIWALTILMKPEIKSAFS